MNGAPAPEASDLRGGLASRSFLGLLATQLLGAFNDNQFRWLVILIGSHKIGEAQATSLGVACFTLPYLLFATHAGYLADRFNKRQIIVGCKLAEIGLMGLAVAGILVGNVYALLAVVFLMGTQSALFGPSKFGSIPEMLRPEKISSGNGVMALVTVVASALGTFVGFVLYRPALNIRPGVAEVAPSAASLLGVAVAGWLTSLLIVRLPVADPARRFPWNPLVETWLNLRFLGRHMALLRATLGIAFFWFLASLANQNINVFGARDLGLDRAGTGALLVVLVAGLGLGSVLAGLWSGGKVELGIVPLGAFVIVVSSGLLYAAGASVDPAAGRSAQVAFWWSGVWLFTLGAGAGLFNIPLEAFLQHRSETETRGVILAAANFVAFALMLVSAGLFYLMQEPLGWSASEIFLAIAVGTVPVLAYIVWLLPGATIRFVVWLASHTVYRVRVRGRENLPERGGALLVANHVSWIDGILLLMVSSRPIRVLAETAGFKSRVLRWLARLYGVIPIHASDGPKALLRSLETAREALTNGELVCIFAEGRVTRTGQLQPFQRGLLRIIEGTAAPVVPVYLDQLWGSVFSFRGGRILRKRPRQWPYPVTISFGPPLPEPDDVDQVRRAVENLGVESVESRKHRELVPARRFVRQCRRAGRNMKVADSAGSALSGRALLAGTLLLARLLRRRVLARDEAQVGVWLPPSLGGVMANAALAVARHVAVNLNYALPDEDVETCVRTSGVRHVLTSRRFLDVRPLPPGVDAVWLEDLRHQATWGDRLFAWCGARVLPVSLLERLLGLRRIGPDDLLTVLFTSGSSGEPKGVMLSQYNIASNIDAADAMYDARSSDLMLGVLPFFHVFGYTLTLWLPLITNARGVYHFDARDASGVGRLCAARRATILLATPSLLREYLKHGEPADFKSLELVISGGEKLDASLAQEFEAKFGVAPTEGYGATELSPLAASNIPRHRAGGRLEKANKPGMVGRAIPGVSAKVVDPDTGKDLGANQEGELLIRGPNVMRGYLDQPERTADVLRDGWYHTGDLARVDDEGFIEITGRLRPAATAAGEGVPQEEVAPA
ncbi:MAG TPA: MFS transporter [Planctomycetaceae bacterium]|nr:MFS transporter [Planctomycetaceae bacterium]